MVNGLADMILGRLTLMSEQNKDEIIEMVKGLILKKAKLQLYNEVNTSKAQVIQEIVKEVSRKYDI